MRNIAVILAGGQGQRAGAGVPKQFRTLADGKTVLETCIAVFEHHTDIDAIAVVMLADYLEQAQTIVRQAGFTKVAYWIPGGRERWESSLFAVEALKNSLGEEEVNVLLHDAARPFLSPNLITGVCKALKTYKAVTVAVPVTDTLYVVQTETRGERLEQVPPRFLFRRAQTPQAFRLSLIYKAYQHAKTNARCWFTDDAGVVREGLPQEKIYVLPGEECNRKLTFQEDF